MKRQSREEKQFLLFLASSRKHRPVESNLRIQKRASFTEEIRSGKNEQPDGVPYYRPLETRPLLSTSRIIATTIAEPKLKSRAWALSTRDLSEQTIPNAGLSSFVCSNAEGNAETSSLPCLTSIPSVIFRASEFRCCSVRTRYTREEQKRVESARVATTGSFVSRGG